MGNHEFCTGCHASDFHTGMSCEEAYPEKFKRVQREAKKMALVQARANRALARLAVAIEKQFGVKVDTWENGLLRIRSFCALDAERERKARKRKKVK
jgi:hypothetical protein